MKKLLFALALMLGVFSFSCTKQNLQDETVATEPGDNTNTNPPQDPDDPDNGED